MQQEGPDQGLRYELAGVAGNPTSLARIARAHPAARVALLDAAGLALLPVTAELAADLTPATLCALDMDVIPGGSTGAARRRTELLTGRESGFTVLQPGLAALIEACSTLGALAYVEADYLSRDGAQAAAVWRTETSRAGRCFWGATKSSRQRPHRSASPFAHSGWRRWAGRTSS